MNMIGWLIILIVLVAIEAATLNLTTIWFAIGSAGAYLCALAGLNFGIQFTVFVILSFVLLIFTKPVAKKYLSSHIVKTNVESLIGQTAKTTSRLNNEEGFGTAVVNGQEWTAISADDNVIIESGRQVIIKEVQGVKLIVTEIIK